MPQEQLGGDARENGPGQKLQDKLKMPQVVPHGVVVATTYNNSRAVSMAEAAQTSCRWRRCWDIGLSALIPYGKSRSEMGHFLSNWALMRFQIHKNQTKLSLRSYRTELKTVFGFHGSI